MPFEQIIPRPFNAGGVQSYAPATSGVYGISNSREWIYIGETADIRGALFGHLQDSRASLMQRGPTGFVYEVCDAERRSGRQTRLVTEYGPSCNSKSRR